jgi:hypothetical protein
LPDVAFLKHPLSRQLQPTRLSPEIHVFVSGLQKLLI